MTSCPAGDYLARFRDVVGKECSGLITLARSLCCGKSLVFRVTMKAAPPASAQAQKASSPGSGDNSIDEWISTISASCRSRLMTSPTRCLRTPNRAKTILYSVSTSYVTSHVNPPPSSHLRRNRALGETAGNCLKAAMPATRTEVSTTPLGRAPFAGNRDLRQSPPARAVALNRGSNLMGSNALEVA